MLSKILHMKNNIPDLLIYLPFDIKNNIHDLLIYLPFDISILS